MPDSTRDDEPEEREPVEGTAAGEQSVPTAYVPRTGMTRAELNHANRVAVEGRRVLGSIDQRTLEQIGEISRLVAQQSQVGRQVFQLMQQFVNSYARTVAPAVEVYQRAIQRNGAILQVLETLGESVRRLYSSEVLNNAGVLAAMRTMAEVAGNEPELFRLGQASTQAIAQAMQPLATAVTQTQTDSATAAIAAMRQYLASHSTSRAEHSLGSNPDADEVESFLGAVDADDSDESIPQPLLAAIFDDLEASLNNDLEDDSLDLPSDLAQSSDTGDLEPLQALYRLTALQYPDLRDNPRLHRILRRAADGSLIATLFLVWLLNPQFFVVLMIVLGILQTNGIGARAVDLTLARGERPHTSDPTPEGVEGEESPENDA